MREQRDLNVIRFKSHNDAFRKITSFKQWVQMLEIWWNRKIVWKEGI